MKILHTSDWHLGQVFKNQNRYEEHQLFLDWLVEQLRLEVYDCLIIAGDLFDVGNPPTEATKQYFNFLIQASQTSLKQIIIIAGNHDFTSTIDAPKELLQAMNIKVVGSLKADPEGGVVELKDSQGLEAKIFCAPYLRAGDLSSIQEDESIDASIRRSIKECYQEGLKLLNEDQYTGIKIATGHLYAAGSDVQDSVRDIQIGKEGRVGVESFGEGYDYVALGHIHKSQRVAQQDHIRYCGSPIPLSFSEYEDQKYLLEVNWNSTSEREIREIAIPKFRDLKRVNGSRADVFAQIKKIAKEDKSQEKLNSWIEVILPEEVPDPYLADEIREQASQLGLRVFGVQMTKGVTSQALEIHQDLNSLEPVDVLNFIIENREDKEQLLQTFKELEQICREEEV